MYATFFSPLEMYLLILSFGFFSGTQLKFPKFVNALFHYNINESTHL